MWFPLIAVVLSAGLPVTDKKPDQRRPDQREQLRYARRTFDEWREDLRTELNLKCRLEALQAMRMFAAHGYAAEACAAALDLVLPLRREKNPDEEEYLLEEAIAAVLRTAGKNAQDSLLAILRGNCFDQKDFVIEYLRQSGTRRGEDFAFALGDVERVILANEKTLADDALLVLKQNIEKAGVLETLAKLLARVERSRREEIMSFLGASTKELLGLANDESLELRVQAIALLLKLAPTESEVRQGMAKVKMSGLPPKLRKAVEAIVFTETLEPPPPPGLGTPRQQ